MYCPSRAASTAGFLQGCHREWEKNTLCNIEKEYQDLYGYMENSSLWRKNEYLRVDFDVRMRLVDSWPISEHKKSFCDAD